MSTEPLARRRIDGTDAAYEGDEQSRLRIAVFTFSYAPFMTGIATGVHTRVSWLVRHGHEVLLAHPRAGEQFSEAIRNRSMSGLEELSHYPNFTSRAYPTKPHPFNRSHPEPLHHRHWSDTELLEEFGPNVVLVEDATGMRGFSSLFLGGYGRPVGYEYSRRTGVPLIDLFETDYVSYSEFYFGRFFMRLGRPLIARLSARFREAYDSTFFPSRTMQEKYRSIGIDRSEHILFHGIDCTDFCPGNIRHDPIPGDSRPTILFVGRLGCEKNVHVLLEAFPMIRESVPDVQLVIIGGGTAERDLRRQAKRFGPSVVFPGEVFGEKLRGWFARADVFVNPSVTENFCTTNLEALASGTPLVAAASGGNVEQVQDGKNGFLVEPHCAADIARRVKAILGDRQLRKRLSAEARRSALHYDNHACMERLESRLIEVARRTKSETFDSVPVCS